MRVFDKRQRTIYSMYRDEEFVDVGTKKELMERHKIKSETFNFMCTKTYHNRINNRKDSKALVIYKVGVLKRNE